MRPSRCVNLLVLRFVAPVLLPSLAACTDVLKLSNYSYIAAGVGTVVVDAVLGTLVCNNICQALYIQNQSVDTVTTTKEARTSPEGTAGLVT